MEYLRSSGVDKNVGFLKEFTKVDGTRWISYYKYTPSRFIFLNQKLIFISTK